MLEYDMENLTKQRLSELLNYDANTGIFTRRVALSRSVKVGDVAGYKHPQKSYISLFVDGKRYKAHRLAWLYVNGVWPNAEIDHINGAPDDNRIQNLRDVSSRTNMENRISPDSRNKSGLLGVSWLSKASKWRAQLQVDGKPMYLGLFDDKDAAHQVYLNAKRAHHGGCTI